MSIILDILPFVITDEEFINTPYKSREYTRRGETPIYNIWKLQMKEYNCALDRIGNTIIVVRSFRETKQPQKRRDLILHYTGLETP